MSKGAGKPQPPQHGRFKKGKSGNPKGRPPRTKPPAVSAFDVIVDRELTITRNGVPCTVSVEEALQHKTYQDAIAGNRSARRDLLKMIAKREKAREERESKTHRPIRSLIEPDPENIDAALLLLEIASPHPDWRDIDLKRKRLLLEPWAVQKTLSRRRGGSKLTADQVREIKRCTRDAESLRWPRGTGE